MKYNQRLFILAIIVLGVVAWNLADLESFMAIGKYSSQTDLRGMVRELEPGQRYKLYDGNKWYIYSASIPTDAYVYKISNSQNLSLYMKPSATFIDNLPAAIGAAPAHETYTALFLSGSMEPVWLEVIPFEQAQSEIMANRAACIGDDLTCQYENAL